MRTKTMTILACVLTLAGLIFNMNYLFSKGLQIGINSEKYERAVFIDDSYNKGLTSGLRRGIILGGKAKFYDDLLEKTNKDKYIEGFFEGYGKGIAEGVQMGIEKCQS